MKKERKKPDLGLEELKKQPFGVPEGYFESFPDRLMKRIREEEKGSDGKLQEAVRRPERPVRTLNRPVRFRIALAAAIVAIALITWPVIRWAIPGNGDSNGYPELALLEEAGIYYNDYELAELLATEEEAMDEDEAYVAQAIEYLAMNDVEMDLLFE